MLYTRWYLTIYIFSFQFLAEKRIKYPKRNLIHTMISHWYQKRERKKHRLLEKYWTDPVLHWFSKIWQCKIYKYGRMSSLEIVHKQQFAPLLEAREDVPAPVCFGCAYSLQLTPTVEQDFSRKPLFGITNHTTNTTLPPPGISNREKN